MFEIVSDELCFHTYSSFENNVFGVPNKINILHLEQ